MSSYMQNNLSGIIVSLIIGATVGGGLGYWAGNKPKAEHPAPITADAQKGEMDLRSAMRGLWGDHMQWTYATVDSFFHNNASVQAHLDQLLANQKNIGAAIAAYYGKEAGDKVTALLTTHIQQAVPVLQAAQAGDKVALDKALADWYANAEEIAVFLSAANPENWPESATKPMMKHHIDTTTTYAVDLLGGDYAKAVRDYGVAYTHMMEMSDVLSVGIIKQFPDKF